MPTENKPQYLKRVVGNKEPIGFRLLDIDGGVAASLSGKTFSVRMAPLPSGSAVVATGTVALDDATLGHVTWSPHADDVDAAGKWALYVIDNSSIPRRWPYDGPAFVLEILSEAG